MVWQLLPHGLLAGAFPCHAGGRGSILARASPVATFRRKHGTNGQPSADAQVVTRDTDGPQVEAQLADAAATGSVLEVDILVGTSPEASDGCQSWYGRSEVVPASRVGPTLDGVDPVEYNPAAETLSRQTAVRGAAVTANGLHAPADAHLPAQFFWSAPLGPSRPGPRGLLPDPSSNFDSQNIHLGFPADRCQPCGSSSAVGVARGLPVDAPPANRSTVTASSAAQPAPGGTVDAAAPAVLTDAPPVPHMGVLYPPRGPSHTRTAAVTSAEGCGNSGGSDAQDLPLTQGPPGPEPQHGLLSDELTCASASAHPAGSRLRPLQGPVSGSELGLGQGDGTLQVQQQQPQRGRHRPSRQRISMDEFLRQYDSHLEAQGSAAAVAKKPASRRSRAGASSSSSLSKKGRSPRDPAASGDGLSAAAPSAAAIDGSQLGTASSSSSAAAGTLAQTQSESPLLGDGEPLVATKARGKAKAIEKRVGSSASAAAPAGARPSQPGPELAADSPGLGPAAVWQAAEPGTASEALIMSGVDACAAAEVQVPDAPPRASSNGRRPRRLSLYTEFELAQGTALGRMPPGSGFSAWDQSRTSGGPGGSSRSRRSSSSSGGGGWGSGVAGAGAAATDAPSRDLEDPWSPEEKAGFWHLVCCWEEPGGAAEAGGAAGASVAAAADPASHQPAALLSLSGTPVLICVRQLEPYGAAEVYELPDLGLGAMDEATWEAWGALPGSSRPNQPLMRIDAGVGLGFELCPEAGRGAGGWCSYEVTVGPGYSHDPARTLHPLRLVCGDRVRYNARHVWDLVEFLADPTVERVAAHLTSVAMLRTGRDREAYHTPAFCHWLLLRRWGAAGLAHVGWGPGDTLRHVRRVRGWNSTLAWEATVAPPESGAGTGTRPARDAIDHGGLAVGRRILVSVGATVLDAVGGLAEVAA